MKKRLIALTLMLSIALSLFSACSSGEEVKNDDNSESQTEVRDTLVYGLNQEPAKLDPQYDSLLVTSLVNKQIYDTLLRKNDTTGKLEPWLATEWEWVDDTTLHMTLRDDVYFHNGEKLTAEDVAYTIKRCAEGSATASLFRSFDAENTTVLDETHVEIKMLEPFGATLNILANVKAGLIILLIKNIMELVYRPFQTQFNDCDLVQCCLIVLSNSPLFLHGGKRNLYFFELVYADVRNRCADSNAFQNGMTLFTIEESLDEVRIRLGFIQLNDIQITIRQDALTFLHRSHRNFVRIAVFGDNQRIILQAISLVLGINVGQVREFIVDHTILNVGKHQILHIGHAVRYHFIQLACGTRCSSRNALNDAFKGNAVAERKIFACISTKA